MVLIAVRSRALDWKATRTLSYTSMRGRCSVEIIKFFSSCRDAFLPAACAMAWSSICAVAYVSLILYRESVWKNRLGLLAKSTGETR